MMTGTALVLASATAAATAYAEYAARTYAATQDRRTAPVCAPRKGRIIDLAG